MIIEIENHGRLQVPDSFKSLSPDQQQAFIAKAIKAKPDKVDVNNVPDRVPLSNKTQKATGAMQGANVGLIKAIGAPVDIANAGIKGLDWLSEKAGVPKDFFTPADKPFGGSEQLRGLAVDNLGIGYKDRKDLPQDQQSIALAGEIFGGSVPFAAAPLGLANTAMKTAPVAGQTMRNVGRDIVQSARTNPAQFTTAEGMMAGGASLGTGFGNEIFPDSPTAQLIGGIAGSLTPTASSAALQRAAPTITKSVKNYFAPKKTAAELLQKTIEDEGENIGDLVIQLRDPSRGNTSVQRTDSTAVDSLADTLAKKDQNLAVRLKEADEAMMQSYHDQMAGYGGADPIFYQKAIDDAINAALDKARTAAGKLYPTKADNPHLVARKALEEAYGKIKIHEEKLWNKVPKALPITPTRTAEAFLEIKSEILPEESLPSLIEGVGPRIVNTANFDKIDALEEKLLLEEALPPFIKKFATKITDSSDETSFIPVDTTQMQRVRSRVLRLKRLADTGGADRNPDSDLSRQLAMLNNSMLRDLESITTNNFATKHRMAREFSNVLHEKFSQGYPAQALGAKATGGERLAPELTLEAGLKSGGTKAYVAANQLEKATEGYNSEAMRQSIGQFMRSMAYHTVDPITGRISEKKLRTFQNDNARLLKNHPELLRDIATATDAEASIRLMLGNSLRGGKAITSIDGLAIDNAPKVVSQAMKTAIASDNPAQLMDLVALAKQTGDPQSISSLRQIIMDYTISQGSKNGVLSARSIRNALPNSLKDTLVEQGVMSETQSVQFDKLVDEIGRMNRRMMKAKGQVEIAEDASFAEDLAVRVVGARVGATLSGGDAGSSILAASAGVRGAKKLVEKIPTLKVKQLLIEAVENPDLMADLLTRPRSAKHQKEIYGRIHAFMPSLFVNTQIPRLEITLDDKERGK